MSKYTKYLVLCLKTGEIERSILGEIENEIIKYKGEYPVYFEVKTSNDEKLILESQKYRVNTNSKLISNLRKILGDDRVLIYG